MQTLSFASHINRLNARDLQAPMVAYNNILQNDDII